MTRVFVSVGDLEDGRIQVPSALVSVREAIGGHKAMNSPGSEYPGARVGCYARCLCQSGHPN